MRQITKITAREILDSRGNFTVEADLWLDDGSMGVLLSFQGFERRVGPIGTLASSD